MTRRFEVLQRDGAARLGKLDLLESPVSTPYILQTTQELKFVREQAGEKGDVDVEVIDDIEKIPSGIEADIVILSGVIRFEKDARNLAHAVTAVKEAVNADAALYAPALATPSNISLLIYAGVDLFDYVLVEVKAREGLFLHEDGEEPFSTVQFHRCECAACKRTQQPPNISFQQMMEVASAHNRAVLNSEILRVQARILMGTLREFVEGRCRATPMLTALLRFLDEDYGYFEKRTPLVRTSTLLACSQESMYRAEIRRFNERVIERLQQKCGILLLLPCSATKPYSRSMSHRRIFSNIREFRRRINEAIITSPIGVVPRSLEVMYPAANYDVPVTGKWTCDEKEWVGDRLYEYLKVNAFDAVVAHVSGPYRDVCEETGSKLGIHVTYTVNDTNVLSTDSLDTLCEVIAGLVREHATPQRDLRFDYLLDTLNYQFGKDVTDAIFPDYPTIRGVFPTYYASQTGKRLATLVRPYGTVTLTIEAAKRYLDKFAGHYCVYIDDFVPKGTVFAVGVVSADPIIRPRDEVLVLNDRIIAVGRALMSGWEMESSSRGGAVAIRHMEMR